MFLIIWLSKIFIANFIKYVYQVNLKNTQKGTKGTAPGKRVQARREKCVWCVQNLLSLEFCSLNERFFKYNNKMDTFIRQKKHCCLPLYGCKQAVPMPGVLCTHSLCVPYKAYPHTPLLTALICLASQLTLNQCLDVVRVSYKHE